MRDLSKIWANILAICFNGDVHYHHINSLGMWEFGICKYLENGQYKTVYKTKGLR